MQLFHSSASMDVPYKPNSKEYELDKNYGNALNNCIYLIVNNYLMSPQLQRRT